MNTQSLNFWDLIFYFKFANNFNLAVFSSKTKKY